MIVAKHDDYWLASGNGPMRPIVVQGETWAEVWSGFWLVMRRQWEERKKVK